MFVLVLQKQPIRMVYPTNTVFWLDNFEVWAQQSYSKVLWSQGWRLVARTFRFNYSYCGNRNYIFCEEIFFKKNNKGKNRHGNETVCLVEIRLTLFIYILLSCLNFCSWFILYIANFLTVESHNAKYLHLICKLYFFYVLKKCFF